MTPRREPTSQVNVNDLITLSEARVIRGVSGTTIYNCIRRGRLSSVFIGNRLLTFRSEVVRLKLIKRQQVRFMTDLELLQDVLRVARRLRHLPTTVEQKKHGTISLITFYRRFGSWKRVKDLIHEKMEQTSKEANRRGRQRGEAESSHRFNYPRLKASYMNLSNLITQAEAGRLRHVTTMTIHNWVKSGRLHAVMIADIPFLLRSEVEAFQMSRQAQVLAMSNEEILRGVMSLMQRLGRMPSSTEYRRYKEADWVALKTLYNRFGSWPKVRERVRVDINSQTSNSSRAPESKRCGVYPHDLRWEEAS
ncbi:MAG: hypothetical protein AUG51_13840 [Acidobacteria bacterium 13_1_20CM_3_53_8]|nr:MAG: hypothetical protein AUG51_13840 [Acidobacteria bacterium 13_1_20CM_3_53_8]